MKHVLTNPYHEVLRFDMGEEVVAGILDFAKRRGIEAAWLSAIGSAQEIELGFYDLRKREYITKTFRAPMELVGASGTLAVSDNAPALHLHGSVGFPDHATRGGHIHRMVANATVEVFIYKIDGRLERQHDEGTGLNLFT